MVDNKTATATWRTFASMMMQTVVFIFLLVVMSCGRVFFFNYTLFMLKHFSNKLEGPVISELRAL